MGERDLRWVDEAETQGLASLKAELGTDLEGLPADIGSDLALARFLRGKKGEVTTEFVRSALQYRRNLIQREDVAKIRETISADELPDQKNNPYIVGTAAGRTALVWRGWAKDGMPVRSLSVRALLSAARETPDEEKAMKASDLEEETAMLFLHKCSEKQQRMVKAWVVIDFCGANVSEVLMSIVPIVKKGIGKHSKSYVETTYRILLLNTPNTISAVVSAVSLALNSRQRSKIVMCAAPTPLQDLAVRFEPDTVLQMINALETSNCVDSKAFTLAPGQHEFVARRAPKGSILKWNIEVENDLMVAHAFLSADGISHSEDTRITEDTRGSLTPEQDGIWCLCLNNYESWQTSKQVEINIAVIEA